MKDIERLCTDYTMKMRCACLCERERLGEREREREREFWSLKSLDRNTDSIVGIVERIIEVLHFIV